MNQLIPIATLLVVLAAPAGAGDQPVVTTDLLRLRTVTSIDVSVDGSKAVLAVRSIGPPKVNESAPNAGEDDENPEGEIDTAAGQIIHLLYDVTT
ncbi:MAG: hypothetical protein IH805_02405 [Proteobacteria bacterium]|nr:hypothetical protein [Pseudomonadota bacterium]